MTSPIHTARALIDAAEGAATDVIHYGDFVHLIPPLALQSLAEHYLAAVEALKEVVAISDRTHDAWDRAHALLAAANADPAGTEAAQSNYPEIPDSSIPAGTVGAGEEG